MSTDTAPKQLTLRNLILVPQSRTRQEETLLASVRRSYVPTPITRGSFLLPTKSLPYVVGNEWNRPHRKNGQMKLFCNELMLFLFYGLLDTPLTVVYAGAAPGHHFEASVRLFPKIKWHLYDDREIMIKHPNVTIHEQLFDVKEAEYWATQPDVVFFSDIRSVGHKDSEGYYIEGSVKDDMEAQQQWVEIMRPQLACLKFRLPYIAGYRPNTTVSYLPGELFVQVFAGATSTEARLVVTPQDYGKRQIYDAAEIENRFFYHNNVTRVMSDWDRQAYDWLVESAFKDSADTKRLIATLVRNPS